MLFRSDHGATKLQLASARTAMSDPQLVELPGIEDEPQVDEELLAAGLSAYGIEREHLAGAGMDPATGQVVMVTAGGSKVRWPLAGKPAQLTAVQITGVSPRAARKPVAGRR